MPSSIISGSTSGDCHWWARTGMAAPAMAPSVSWPSAPMFQTLARKQTASPTPISTSGVALTTQLLDRPQAGHRLDEVDVESAPRVDAARREQDGTHDHHEQDRQNGRHHRHHPARLRAPVRTAASRRDLPAGGALVGAGHQQTDPFAVDRARGDRDPTARRARSPRCDRRSRRSRRDPG